MEFDPNLLKLPEHVFSSGDPVEGNPFPAETPGHAAWAAATRKAEEAFLRLQSEWVTAWRTDDESIRYVCARFDIWAWRGTCVGGTESWVQSYDNWLQTYAEGWLDSFSTADQLRRRPIEEGELFLRELRRALSARLYHWRAEVRRLKREFDESRRASPPTPRESALGKTQNRRRVDDYIAEVLRDTGTKITRKDFWVAAGYSEQTPFTRWQRGASDTRPAERQRFERILLEKPHLKQKK